MPQCLVFRFLKTVTNWDMPEKKQKKKQVTQRNPIVTRILESV